MWLNDAIVGVVLVLFAIAEIAYSTTFPTLHGQAYGPSLFPTLIGCALIGCGLLLIIRGLRSRPRQVNSLEPARIDTLPDSAPGEGAKAIASSDASASARDAALEHNWFQPGDWAADPSRRINMLLVPGLLIVYILLSDEIGFILLSLFILSVLLYRLGSSLLVSLGIAVVTTVLLQFLFARVLLVPLPAGLLLPWLS